MKRVMTELGKELYQNRLGLAIGGFIGSSTIPLANRYSSHLSTVEGDVVQIVIPAIGIAGGLCTGFLIQSFNRETSREMSPPTKIYDSHVRSYPNCQVKTNRGYDTVILVSDGGMGMLNYQNYNVGDAKKLKRYLEEHHSFLNYHTDRVHLVRSAKSIDFKDAIQDPEVANIVLFGHASVGSYRASDVFVSHHEVAEWVKNSGHCKNGFGLKAGCNVLIGEEIRKKKGLPDDVDQYVLLSPAYSHEKHAGDLFIVEGVPISGGKKYLPGSEITYGLRRTPKLLRLVPALIDD